MQSWEPILQILLDRILAGGPILLLWAKTEVWFSQILFTWGKKRNTVVKLSQNLDTKPLSLIFQCSISGIFSKLAGSKKSALSLPRIESFGQHMACEYQWKIYLENIFGREKSFLQYLGETTTWLNPFKVTELEEKQ